MGTRSLMKRGQTLIISLSVVLLFCVIISIGHGALYITPLNVIKIILEPLGSLVTAVPEQEAAILWGIRLPRVVLAVFVGATLGVSGAVLQGLFRNPLAEPGLIGISAGASLAAATFMVFGSRILNANNSVLGQFTLPFVAFLGAMSCATLIHRTSVIHGRTSITTMLLAGIAFNAIGFALLGILQYVADDQQLRSLTFWMMGSLSGSTWELLIFTVPMMLFTIIVAPFLAHSLNLLQLGESEASHLGINIELLKRLTVLIVALGVGAAVSVSGMIGFIGLIVPHIIRMSSTPNHKILIPASAILGSIILLGADLISRTVVMPAEMPVGIITTLMGAPFFVVLLLKQRFRLH